MSTTVVSFDEMILLKLPWISVLWENIKTGLQQEKASEKQLETLSGDSAMNDQLINNVKAGHVWKRALFMFLFVIIYSVTKVVLTAVVVFQFFHVLLTGNKNPRLLELGNNLSTLIFQILQFLTFNSDDHPYPLGNWPDVATPSSEDAVEDHTPTQEETKEQ